MVPARARYQHAALEEILHILESEDDWELNQEPDGSWSGPWLDTRPDAPSLPAPMERRVLATMRLTPGTLDIETISRERLEAGCQRLEGLLGDRIRRGRAPRRRKRLPSAAPEAVTLPPEFLAEMEERMLRQWIDEPVPALGGQTPREAVKTADGRRRVLALIEDNEQMRERAAQIPGMFTPDYRKVKGMLGL